MTAGGMRRLDPQPPRNLLLLGLAPGADAQATLARHQREASATPPPRPADVGNWGRVDAFPYLAAALIGVGAAALLAQALITSIRRRDRDLAILKTLGFERRDVRATVAWQATTVAAIGLLVGLPLGVLLGRFAWNIFATELGVVSEPVAPALVGLSCHSGRDPARQPRRASAGANRRRHKACGRAEGGVRWPWRASD